MLLEAEVSNTIWLTLQWILAMGALIFISLIILKWVLKKSFPRMRELFYFLVPTYIAGAIITIAIGYQRLNEHTMFPFPSFVFYLCPPLVWDALLAVGLAEENILQIIVSLFFILFMPLWFALKTSAGLNKEEEEESKLNFLKRLASAWIIVTIMGIGMPNFYFYIITSLVITNILGISLIIWTIIAFIIIVMVFFLIKKHKFKNDHPDNGCQLIDGEWVCPFGKKPPK